MKLNPIETMASDTPLITVVITAFNRPDYLQSSVASALAQEGVDLEIIVVDDCSPTDLRPVFDAIVTTSVKRLGCNIAIVLICSGDTYSPQAMATPAGLTPVPGPQVMPVDPDANFPSRAIGYATLQNYSAEAAQDPEAHATAVPQRFVVKTVDGGATSGLY